MEPYFQISIGGNVIRIEPQSYTYLNEDNDWDNNWVKTKVIIKAGSFSGILMAEFMTTYFEKLKNDLIELYNDLSGSSIIEDMEGYLKMKIIGDGNGHFQMNIEACDNPGIYGSYLRFSLEFDQTYIKTFISELDTLTKEFPIIGRLK